MGSSLVPPASGSASIPSDNWQLISSVTPTGGVSTVTFSSISGYKKLLVRYFTISSSAYTGFTMRFNSDTAANYAHSLVSYQSINLAGADVDTNQTAFTLSGIGTGSSDNKGLIYIDNANTTGVKQIGASVRYNLGGGVVHVPNYTGAYFASAAITSVSLIIQGANTFNAAGTVALYGVLA